GPEILRRLHVSPQWFNLVTGALLIVQLIVTPDGMVTDVQHKLQHLLQHRAARRPARAGEVDLAVAETPAGARGEAAATPPVRTGGAQ
ncbi:MAG: hypothetical protein QOD57_3970, partial [Actinomycetota bacterium]|nr:hypothetical protein [Actinomycetota bacterium]